MIQKVDLDAKNLIKAAQESLSNKRMTDAFTDSAQVYLEMLKFVTTAASCMLANALTTDSPFHCDKVKEFQSTILRNIEEGISRALEVCRTPAEVGIARMCTTSSASSNDTVARAEREDKKAAIRVASFEAAF